MMVTGESVSEPKIDQTPTAISSSATAKHDDKPSRNAAADFSEAFQCCLASLTTDTELRDFPSHVDAEESKNSVEQAVHRFFETSKKLDVFFAREALIFAAHCPVQVLQEELTDMKAQLDRQNSLLQKHSEKLLRWQGLLQLKLSTPSTTPETGQAASATSGR